MTTATTIGQQIRRYRMAAGLTIIELATRADVSRGYISALEHESKTDPSALLLARIAHEIGVSVQDLLDEQPPPVRCKHWAIQWQTHPGGAIACQSCGTAWALAIEASAGEVIIRIADRVTEMSAGKAPHDYGAEMHAIRARVAANGASA